MIHRNQCEDHPLHDDLHRFRVRIILRERRSMSIRNGNHIMNFEMAYSSAIRTRAPSISRARIPLTLTVKGSPISGYGERMM